MAHYKFSIIKIALGVGVMSGLILGLCLPVARRFFRAPSRSYTPERHTLKYATPTMGGLFLIGCALVGVGMLGLMLQGPVMGGMATLLLFGVIGAYDDWCKIAAGCGISAWHKWCAQLISAGAIACWWYWYTNAEGLCWIPGFGMVAIGIPVLVWWMFVILALSNAMNFTDGLDGLATGVYLPVVATYGLIAAFYSQAAYAYELAQWSSILTGVMLAFAWYNRHPARIFMGDAGSLSLGAALALLAIQLGWELLLPVIGFVFVLETCSVMVQVIGYQRWGVRVFRMAPLHHHFELVGWSENSIVLLASGITIGLCALVLMVMWYGCS